MRLKAAVRAARAPYRVAEAVNVRSVDQLFISDIVVVDARAVTMGTVAVDIEAVPLIVEVVSPGNSSVDRLMKPVHYAELETPG